MDFKMPDKRLFQRLDSSTEKILYEYVICVENTLHDKNFSHINGLPQNIYMDVDLKEGLYILPNYNEPEISQGTRKMIQEWYYRFRTFVVLGFQNYDLRASSSLKFEKLLYGTLYSEVLNASSAKKV